MKQETEDAIVGVFWGLIAFIVLKLLFFMPLA